MLALPAPTETQAFLSAIIASVVVSPCYQRPNFSDSLLEPERQRRYLVKRLEQLGDQVQLTAKHAA